MIIDYMNTHHSDDYNTLQDEHTNLLSWEEQLKILNHGDSLSDQILPIIDMPITVVNKVMYDPTFKLKAD